MSGDIRQVHENRFKNKHFNAENCHYCGENHKKNKCPVYGKICMFYKKSSHFQICCQKKRNEKTSNSMIKANEVHTFREYNIHIKISIIQIEGDLDKLWINTISDSHNQLVFPTSVIKVRINCK